MIQEIFSEFLHLHQVKNLMFFDRKSNWSMYGLKNMIIFAARNNLKGIRISLIKLGYILKYVLK